MWLSASPGTETKVLWFVWHSRPTICSLTCTTSSFAPDLLVIIITDTAGRHLTLNVNAEGSDLFAQTVCTAVYLVRTDTFLIFIARLSLQKTITFTYSYIPLSKMTVGQDEESETKTLSPKWEDDGRREEEPVGLCTVLCSAEKLLELCPTASQRREH